MSKIYCPECGAPIEYSAKKPNFCLNCGHPLNKEAAATTERDLDVSLNEEIEGQEESLDIQEGFELDIEYVESPRSKGFKLGDIADSLSEDSSLAKGSGRKKRGRPPKQNNQKIWDQFKDDAGGNPAKENFDE